MTIGEKAFSYIKEQFPKGSYTIATLATIPAQCKGFKAGAEWMQLSSVFGWQFRNMGQWWQGRLY